MQSRNVKTANCSVSLQQRTPAFGNVLQRRTMAFQKQLATITLAFRQQCDNSSYDNTQHYTWILMYLLCEHAPLNCRLLSSHNCCCFTTARNVVMGSLLTKPLTPHLTVNYSFHFILFPPGFFNQTYLVDLRRGATLACNSSRQECFTCSRDDRSTGVAAGHLALERIDTLDTLPLLLGL